ncbi:MAG: SRPBCC family protein [Paracoccaceae bacterium]
MKVASRHDIEAPPAFVFDTLTDFDSWERSAMRRGADVTRTDKLTTVTAGLAWLIRFRFRAKDRKLAVRLTSVDAPARLSFAISGNMFEATSIIDLMELGAKRTRLVVVSEAKPKSLAARLILQSLRLARARVQRRVDGRIGAIASEIEDRYRQQNRPRGMGIR